MVTFSAGARNGCHGAPGACNVTHPLSNTAHGLLYTVHQFFPPKQTYCIQTN